MPALKDFLLWVEKAGVCPVGTHEHNKIDGCHPVGQHHRFEHRQVGGWPREFTVPEYRPPSSAAEAEETAEEEEAYTFITPTDVARAHGIPAGSLIRRLNDHWSFKDQKSKQEYFTPEGIKFAVTEIHLTPYQVRAAHEIAAEVSRRSSSRSRPARLVGHV